MSSALPPPAAPAQVECPQCLHPVPFFDAINSAFFGCPKCHTFFEYGETGMPKKLRKFNELPKQQLPLPIGTTGELEGNPYRVVGYTLRKEARTKARWEEYVLWNEAKAVVHQLAVFEGHWILIEPIGEFYRIQQENKSTSYLEIQDQTFQLYNRYSPRILYAEGEFDWNVLEDEKLNVREFINPPLMRISEQHGKATRQWFAGRHLEPSQIEKGFNVLPQRMPWRNGVGAVQPAPSGGHWQQLYTFSLVMALLVVVTHLVLSFGGSEKVLEKDFTIEAPTAPATTAGNSIDRAVLVSPTFTVPTVGALDIKLWAGVDNTWVELPFSLVNEQTGQLFEASSGVEYYHGVEDGESWSEGDNTTSATLGRVPAGRYHLNFYPATDVGNAAPISFKVEVETQASPGSNVLLTLLLLLVFPAIQYYRRAAHEYERWNGSDYSPASGS